MFGFKGMERSRTTLLWSVTETEACLHVVETTLAYLICFLAQYTYDQPDAVAQALGGSLTAVMDVSHPDFKKKGEKSTLVKHHFLVNK